MKLSDSRIAKNIFSKGDSIRRIKAPSLSETKETYYLDKNRLVLFKRDLIRSKKNTQKRDHVKFFKEYNN